MDRIALQHLAVAKFDDAELLFQHGRFSNSYYLFGYAVEIALKARISQAFRENTIPDKKFVNDLYTHDLLRLVTIAGLRHQLDERQGGSAAFAGHWSTVANWQESSRYEVIDAFASAAMRRAMVHPSEGVFQWLQVHW